MQTEISRLGFERLTLDMFGSEAGEGVRLWHHGLACSQAHQGAFV